MPYWLVIVDIWQETRGERQGTTCNKRPLLEWKCRCCIYVACVLTNRLPGHIASILTILFLVYLSQIPQLYVNILLNSWSAPLKRLFKRYFCTIDSCLRHCLFQQRLYKSKWCDTYNRLAPSVLDAHDSLWLINGAKASHGITLAQEHICWLQRLYWTCNV